MGNGVDEETTINIVNLESSLRFNMSEENKFRAHKCCIFKTPNILSRHNKGAYVPDAFSFGPMHYGEAHLKTAEKIKSLYLADFLKRSTKTVKFFVFQPFSLTTVIEAVRAVEAEARACYAERIYFSREKFVEILVMDGCFLMELLLRHDRNDPDDPVQSMACMNQFLYHDLVLLENQIPWLVLQAIFNHTTAADTRRATLKALVVAFFGHHFSTADRLPEPPGDDFKHILDLLRESLISTFKKGGNNGKWKRIPSAVELKEAGVTLVVRPDRPNQPNRSNRADPVSILYVEFKDGTLVIPNLMVQETTEATFRNLICYEQCFPNCEPMVTSYAILMDNLIDTSKDLEKLCDAGIVDNWLDPQDATKMFNNLYNDANVTQFYYMDMCADVEKYCKRWFPRWRAGYVHNYFSTPWAIVSQVVGTVVLVLTVLQTYYTISPG